MSRANQSDRPRVAIVGGGLGGLAAAVALAAENCEIELFESRRRLGGRAASFRDPATGELVDFCQHVSMGCCTNLADFCQRTDLAEQFRREPALCFIGPNGQRSELRPSPLLPAPVHLAAALWKMKYLSRRDRVGVARAMWRMMRTADRDVASDLTIGQWLRDCGQSAAAQELFWAVVLVSALGETLDRASFAAARKVFVDGFMSHRRAYEVLVPQRPLSELFHDGLHSWLTARGVQVSLSTPVRQVDAQAGGGFFLTTGDKTQSFDFVILALTWRIAFETLSPALQAQLPQLARAAAIEPAPITGVHLWFDRPITELRHAVLVGRLSQWLFNRGSEDFAEKPSGHYYQVVISASRDLAGRTAESVVQEVCQELAAIWPAARDAKLLRSRVVTEPHAVFSTRPDFERFRPPQRTSVSGLLLAGDWTATGWPATMEGAVRSGRLAAEGVLAELGRPRPQLSGDLPRGWLARRLIRG